MFRDQGLILNTNGYTGSIEVKDSEFIANQAYIQEILMYESLETDKFYSFYDNEMITEFSDDDQYYLKFKACYPGLWYGRYLF